MNLKIYLAAVLFATSCSHSSGRSSDPTRFTCLLAENTYEVHVTNQSSFPLLTIRNANGRFSMEVDRQIQGPAFHIPNNVVALRSRSDEGTACTFRILRRSGGYQLEEASPVTQAPPEGTTLNFSQVNVSVP